MDYRIEIPETITEIDGDKAYPIFRVEAHFKYDGVDKDYCGSSRLYQTMPSSDTLIKDLNEWWVSILNKEPVGEDKVPIAKKNPVIQNLRVFLSEYETWCIRWFSHYTYVENRSDEELKQSFARFVIRKLPLHRNNDLPSDYVKDKGLKTYCLMGAEEDWRHKEPCHCDDCQKLGIAHIMH